MAKAVCMIYVIVIQCEHTPYIYSSINLTIAKNEFSWQYAKLI